MCCLILLLLALYYSGEQSLGDVVANVLTFIDDSKKWVPMGHARVHVCYTPANNSSRFLGFRSSDQEVKF